MAGSPLVVDYMQVTITTTLPDSSYAHGMTGLFVYGYVTFGTNGYFEPVQYVNLKKQMFFPANRRFDTFKYQGKVGVNFSIKPIYGNLDVFGPTVDGNLINLSSGAVAGLAVKTPAGLPGPSPVLIPLIP